MKFFFRFWNYLIPCSTYYERNTYLIHRINDGKFLNFTSVEKIIFMIKTKKTYALNNSTLCGKPIKTDDLVQLNYLDLSSNNFRYLPPNIFVQQKNLKIFLLTENSLRTIEMGAFNRLNVLETLRINHNNLSYLQSGVFEGLEKLSILDLSYNKVNEIHLEEFRNSRNIIHG